MRFSRTNMRLAAARCRSLSRKIGVQTAEFSITAFCWRNTDSSKSRTYERHNAEIRLELFNLSQAWWDVRATGPVHREHRCPGTRTSAPPYQGSVSFFDRLGGGLESTRVGYRKCVASNAVLKKDGIRAAGD